MIRTGLDALYYTGAHLLLRPFCAGVGFILMLHHVRPARGDEFQPNKLLEVSPEFLAQTIRWLRRENIDLVSLDEMRRRLIERDFARRFACVTLDDGYRDNRTFAYPIFKHHEVPFTVYVPTSFPERNGNLWWLALERAIARNETVAVRMLGSEHTFACGTPAEKQAAYEEIYRRLREMADETEILAVTDDLATRSGFDMRATADKLCMDWDEIRTLASDPLVTIGAHTINHVMLGKAGDDAARSELKLSREILEAKLGRPVRHLAYPYGGRDLVGTREFAMAAELGYETAVTTRPGVLFPEHSRVLTALPRISLNGLYQYLRHVKVLSSGAATAVFNGFRRLDVA